MGSNSSKVTNAKEVTLYFNPVSPFARTAQMVARTCEVKVNYVEINLMKNEQHKDWFLKLNPKHTVPVLVDDDTVLTETVDICKYLIDNYGIHKEMNPSGETGEKMQKIVDYYYGTLFPSAMKILSRFFSKKPVSERDLEAVRVHGYEYFNNLLGNNDFLFETKGPTWVDLLVFSGLLQMDIYPLTRKGKHDKVKLWSDRIMSYPFADVHGVFFFVTKFMYVSHWANRIFCCRKALIE